MTFDPLGKILGKKIKVDLNSRNNGYDRESDIENECFYCNKKGRFKKGVCPKCKEKEDESAWRSESKMS